MTAALSTLAKLKPNPRWAKLRLFSRKNWLRVRFGDVVENLNEACEPETSVREWFIELDHLAPRLLHEG